MINSINLPDKIFEDNVITGLKKKNFIYGKNGTGKSTITRYISKEYSEKYDVRLFNGFDSIIEENGGLNTIALGTINVELQPKINSKMKEIDDLKNNIERSDINTNNLYSRLEKSKSEYSKAQEKMDRFFLDLLEISKRVILIGRDLIIIKIILRVILKKLTYYPKMIRFFTVVLLSRN